MPERRSARGRIADSASKCEHALGHDGDEPARHAARCCRSTRACPAGEAQCAQRAKQGRAVFGIEMRSSMPTAASSARTASRPANCRCAARGSPRGYLPDRDARDADGWFPTGDIATSTPTATCRSPTAEGRHQVGRRVDQLDRPGERRRASGRAEAAMIGARHPKWDERPVLFVVPSAGATIDRDNFWRSSPARWRSGGSPTTSSSSTSCRTPRPASSKLALRARFQDYLLQPRRREPPRSFASARPAPPGRGSRLLVRRFIAAAPTFSSRCATLPVPGIGSITGLRFKSQASAIWPGSPCACGDRSCSEPRGEFAGV